jgi:hypothetical protein
MSEPFYVSKIINRIIQLGLYDEFSTTYDPDEFRGCGLTGFTVEEYGESIKGNTGFFVEFNSYEDDYDTVIRPFLLSAGIDLFKSIPTPEEITRFTSGIYSPKNKTVMFKSKDDELSHAAKTSLFKDLKSAGVFVSFVNITWSVNAVTVNMTFYANQQISAAIMSNSPMKTRIGHRWSWSKGPEQFKKSQSKVKVLAKVIGLFALGATIGAVGTVGIQKFKKDKKL